jgi:glyoxylase-like metal-dependent hydrolase (beta-lactamase superfamily II)
VTQARSIEPIQLEEEPTMPELPSWRVPIKEGCFMVGHRNPRALLQCNTFLRTFAPGTRSAQNWCVDPGSQVDYPKIRKHLLEHLGTLEAIQLFSINHQDPDVVGNLTYLSRANRRLTGLVAEDTWRLVRHLRIRPHKLLFTNKLGHHSIHLPSGQRIQVLPTPFCHFRGAVAYYDPESRILFSGDLFGGLNKPGRVQLFGEEEDWSGIAQFHQIYMPTRSAVAHAIRQVRALRPRVDIIAPQHGFLLKGDFMHTVLERLEDLSVGMDLLSRELDKDYLKEYRLVLRDVLACAAGRLGRVRVLGVFDQLPKEHFLRRCLSIQPGEVELMRNGIKALPLVIHELTDGRETVLALDLKSAALEGCIRQKIPLPDLGVGMEGDRA